MGKEIKKYTVLALFKIIPRHFYRGSEKYHEETLKSQWRGGDSNWAPPG
jgi:hypothetical protein